MSRVRVVLFGLAVLGSVGACSGSGGHAPRDGAPLGTPYACAGGVVFTPDGEVPASSPPVTCVVGQSFCDVELEDDVANVQPGHSCRSLLADGGLGACTDNPTCSCICAQGVICVTECSCDDSNGFVTITCHQV